MIEDPLPQIFILIALILLSGVFSGAEIALISLSPARLNILLQSKKSAAKVVEKLKSNPQKLLITILIGNNIVNIAASGIATLLFTQLFGSKGLGIATGVMTFFVLVFGEITPKTLAEAHAEKFSLWIARPIYWLQIILTPVIWVFEKITDGMFIIFGIEKNRKKATEDELRALSQLTHAEGEIDRGEVKMIENVLDLDETLVSEIMTPRADILALPDTITITQALEFFHENNRSRIPVFHLEMDDMVGYFSVRNLLLHKNEAERTLAQIELPKPILAPETMPARQLFRQMRREKCHLAIILDENGSVTGLCTLEDILEEIVGEIFDETDKEEATVRQLDKNIIVAAGNVDVEVINDMLGTELDDEDHKTIALLILEKLGRFPHLGEAVEFREAKMIIQKIKRNRIERVKIVRKF